MVFKFAVFGVFSDFSEFESDESDNLCIIHVVTGFIISQYSCENLTNFQFMRGESSIILVFSTDSIPGSLACTGFGVFPLNQHKW